MAPPLPIEAEGRSDVRRPWATVCVATVATDVRGPKVTPQSEEEIELMLVVLPAYETTPRPHGDECEAAGLPGWTSATEPVPTDASVLATAVDQVAPPSVERENISAFAGLGVFADVFV